MAYDFSLYCFTLTQLKILHKKEDPIYNLDKKVKILNFKSKRYINLK